MPKVKAAHPVEIQRKPRDVEIKTVVMREPLHPKRPHAARTDDRFPRGRTTAGNRLNPWNRQQGKLCRVHRGVRARIVPVPAHENQAERCTG
jgi:hypothetical protein